MMKTKIIILALLLVATVSSFKKLSLLSKSQQLNLLETLAKIRNKEKEPSPQESAKIEEIRPIDELTPIREPNNDRNDLPIEVPISPAATAIRIASPASEQISNFEEEEELEPDNVEEEVEIPEVPIEEDLITQEQISSIIPGFGTGLGEKGISFGNFSSKYNLNQNEPIGRKDLKSNQMENLEKNRIPSDNIDPTNNSNNQTSKLGYTPFIDYVPKSNVTLAEQLDYKLKLGNDLILPPTFVRLSKEVVNAAEDIINYSEGSRKKKFERTFRLFEALTRRLQSISLTPQQNLPQVIRTLEIYLETVKATLLSLDDLSLQSYFASQQAIIILTDKEEFEEARRVGGEQLGVFANYFASSAGIIQEWALKMVRTIELAVGNLEGEEVLHKALRILAERYIHLSAEALYLQSQALNSNPATSRSMIASAELLSVRADPQLKRGRKRSKGKKGKKPKGKKRRKPPKSTKKDDIDLEDFYSDDDVPFDFSDSKRRNQSNSNSKNLAKKRKSMNNLAKSKQNINENPNAYLIETLNNSLKRAQLKEWKNQSAKRLYLFNIKKNKEDYFNSVINLPRRVIFTDLRQFAKYFSEFKQVSLPIDLSEDTEGIFSRNISQNFFEYFPQNFPEYKISALDPVKKDLRNLNKTDAIIPFQNEIVNTADGFVSFEKSMKILKLSSEIDRPRESLINIENGLASIYASYNKFLNSGIELYKELTEKAEKEALSSHSAEFFKLAAKTAPSTQDFLFSLSNVMMEVQNFTFQLSKVIYSGLNQFIKPARKQYWFVRKLIRWQIWAHLSQNLINSKGFILSNTRYIVDEEEFSQNIKSTLEDFKNSVESLRDSLNPDKILGYWDTETNEYIEGSAQVWIYYAYEKEVNVLNQIIKELEEYENWDGLVNPEVLYTENVKFVLDDLENDW